jgi:hypothetical protein
MKFSDLKAALEVATPLEKSLGLRSAAPRFTEEQVSAASAAAMQAGVLSPEVCQHVASAMALGGVGAVPASIIDLLQNNDA